MINYLSTGAGFLKINSIITHLRGRKKMWCWGDIHLKTLWMCWKSIYHWTKSPVYGGFIIVEIFPKRSGLGSEIICPDCLKGLVCLVHVLVESAMFGLLVVEIVTFFFHHPKWWYQRWIAPQTGSCIFVWTSFLTFTRTKEKHVWTKKSESKIGDRLISAYIAFSVKCHLHLGRVNVWSSRGWRERRGQLARGKCELKSSLYKDFFLEEKESGNQFYIPLFDYLKRYATTDVPLYLLTAFGSELPQPHQLGSWRLLFGLPGFPGENGCWLPYAPRCTGVKWISNLTSHQIADWEHWEDADDNRQVQ